MRRSAILVLVVACAFALVVGWVVLTPYIFPDPFASWSPYAKEYYELSGSFFGSAYYEYMKAKAEEIAKQTDGVVNVADVREAVCQIWVETARRMPPATIVDYAYTNGFISNVTIVPESAIDTMEKAYLALEIWEIFLGDRERVIELLALDK